MLPFKNVIFAEIAVNGITVFTPKTKISAFYPFPKDIFSSAFEYENYDFSFLPKIKKSYAILVANTRKVIVRFADISGLPAQKLAKKFSKDDLWQFVIDNFSIGEKINENTHLFDGSVFFNLFGEPRLFLAALPFNFCNIFAKIGIQLVGSIHNVSRLDTAEHLLFRKYLNSAHENEPSLIFLPQDNGLRILFSSNNLPSAAHNISNNPSHREDELLIFMNHLDLNSQIASPPRKAIFIQNEYPTPYDYTWLRKFLLSIDFEITSEPLFYCSTN